MQGAECQAQDWRDHKPYCLRARSIRGGHIVDGLSQEFPGLERDFHHYKTTVTPRLAEATFRALALPAHPNKHAESAFIQVVRYRPWGPTSLQRFVPSFNSLVSMDTIRSLLGAEVLQETLDERERQDAQVRAEGKFGAAIIAIIIIMPDATPAHGSSAPPEPRIHPSFQILRISQAQSLIPGDVTYGRDLFEALQMMSETGVAIPRTQAR